MHPLLGFSNLIVKEQQGQSVVASRCPGTPSSYVLLNGSNFVLHPRFAYLSLGAA